MRLTLVRHGESIWNATDRWQGQSDVPLSELGRMQARAVGERLREERFDRVMTSDLSRAIQTAEAIGPAEREPRLREIDVGEWAGLSHTEVAQRFPDELRALREGGAIPIGGGESMKTFEARIDGLIDELATEHAGRSLLLVTHGGVIRALTTRVLAMRGRRAPVGGVENTSLTRVEWTASGPVLRTFNDIHHVPGGLRTEQMEHQRTQGTTLALIADDGREARAGLADQLLTSLRIARVFAVRRTPLADGMRAVGHSGAEAELIAEHADEAVALLAPPERVRAIVVERIGDAPLAQLEHASTTALFLGSRVLLTRFGAK